MLTTFYHPRYAAQIGEHIMPIRKFGLVRDAIARYGLPANLKLSVHSGSDKFSLYPIIRRTLPKFDAGVHLKTAGTTWLEELIGLAEAGGDRREGEACAERTVWAITHGLPDRHCN